MSAMSSPMSVSLSTRACPGAQPLYFGPTTRPLFGWLHVPAHWRGARVVLCAPLGYEGLFAHPSLRVLAERLATEAHAVVLRFDYDGTGDSAGSDEDPERVAAWLASVDAAIDELTRRAPSSGPTLLVGLRAGGLLGAIVAARRHDVQGLALWATVTSGRAFAREQRAFSLLSHVNSAVPGGSDLDWGPGGFEANGYVFRDDTVKALGMLDLGSLDRPPASRILVLDRAESPAVLPMLEQWTRLTEVAVEPVDDYQGMIAPPLTMVTPDSAIAHIVRWVGSTAGDAASAPAAYEASPVAHVAPGVDELPVWFGTKGEQFGILTQPTGRPGRRAMLFLNNAAGYRVGPHGVVPMVARALAERGVSSLRIDVAGVGDSRLPASRPDHHPYNLDTLEDVRAAIEVLVAEGFDDIAAGGLCSAAFIAWHAAQRCPEIRWLVLMNPQTFEWNEGDSLDVSPLQDQYEMNHYKNSARSIEKWSKLLRGEVQLSYVVSVVWSRVRFAVNCRLQALRVMLRIGGGGSSAARIIRALAARGGSTWFIFSGDDPGIAYLEGELGGSMTGLQRRGALHVEVVPHSDHSFTPRWATRTLTARLLVALADGDHAARAG